MDRLQRIKAAQAETKALRAWEASGQQGDRPDTPVLDGAADTHAPKKAARKKAEPKPRKDYDQMIRDLWLSGRFTHWASFRAIHEAYNLGGSCFWRAFLRLTSSGELIAHEGRPVTYWLVAAGDAPDPPATPEPKARKRKVHSVAAVSGIVHDAYAFNGPEGRTYRVLCVPEDRVLNVSKVDPQDPTCKRCDRNRA